MLYKDKYVNSTEDIPKESHWAIVTGCRVFIPGDERSKTNPGHGYPERTENFITYRAYLKFEDFEADLKGEYNRNPDSNAKGIYVREVYSKQISIEIKKEEKT